MKIAAILLTLALAGCVTPPVEEAPIRACGPVQSIQNPDGTVTIKRHCSRPFNDARYTGIK